MKVTFTDVAVASTYLTTSSSYDYDDDYYYDDYYSYEDSGGKHRRISQGWHRYG